MSAKDQTTIYDVWLSVRDREGGGSCANFLIRPLFNQTLSLRPDCVIARATARKEEIRAKVLKITASSTTASRRHRRLKTEKKFDMSKVKG
jgi:hypothetical protein